MIYIYVIIPGLFSLIPKLHSPACLAECRKTGREPGPFHHVLHDVGCVVLLFELRVTPTCSGLQCDAVVTEAIIKAMNLLITGSVL